MPANPGTPGGIHQGATACKVTTLRPGCSRQGQYRPTWWPPCIPLHPIGGCGCRRPDGGGLASRMAPGNLCAAAHPGLGVATGLPTGRCKGRCHMAACRVRRADHRRRIGLEGLTRSGLCPRRPRRAKTGVASCRQDRAGGLVRRRLSATDWAPRCQAPASAALGTADSIIRGPRGISSIEDPGPAVSADPQTCNRGA
jgi:hypothetical protein